jgi:hypothetical protein
VNGLMSMAQTFMAQTFARQMFMRQPLMHTLRRPIERCSTGDRR